MTNCAHCGKTVPLKYNNLKQRIEPASKYFLERNKKIVEMYCSVECGLKRYKP